MTKRRRNSFEGIIRSTFSDLLNKLGQSVKQTWKSVKQTNKLLRQGLDSVKQTNKFLRQGLESVEQIPSTTPIRQTNPKSVKQAFPFVKQIS